MLIDHFDIQYDKVVRMALQVVATLTSSKGSTSLVNGEKKTPSTLEVKVKESGMFPLRGKQQQQPVKLQNQPQLNKYFHMFMVELLKLFDSNRTLLETKGSFIIRSVLHIGSMNALSFSMNTLSYSMNTLSYLMNVLSAI